ncbi:cysteine desulfurase [Clostridium sp. YIM B02515]|uniref:cysteine desulfurase n=1 Tax=Clostridium rhizosphaerae TaxID=2803861 RepID=A0ABS1TAJ0_9CLOT|nr:cysteine desulfurase [Clostridium rhizosphaerae]MBL4936362.1 cysteine desulfurase [Clostridium rhizosphaerae]
MRDFKVEEFRKDFPILSETVHGNPLVYLDNAATTHKPNQVLEAMRNYHHKHNGNPHRGAHYLSVMATEAYENTREKVRKFINAARTEEIIFTRNATESLNLIAYSYGMNFINEGDEIVLCISEHHSNIVPWQKVAKAKKAVLKYMYLNSDFRLDMNEVKEKITDKTKFVGIAQMSNVLGTIYPVKEIAEYAHTKGAVVLVDGAQAVPHIKVDVRDIDADFFVFSGHKMLAPMGIGVLYGKKELLEKMPPFLFGGDMIEYVEEQNTTFAELPFKFEAGTQNVEGAVGLSAAIDYLEDIGLDKIHEYEMELTAYALDKMKEIPYVKIYGSTDLKNRGGVISFSIEGCHPHDVSSIVDTYGVAIRAGHHCAQPLMKFVGAPATSRASFYFYNTKEEVDVFIDSIKNVRRWLGYGS